MYRLYFVFSLILLQIFVADADSKIEKQAFALSQKQDLVPVKNAEDISMDYLITKLNRLHYSLPSNHKAKRAITLRLAHTLSLRAEYKMSQTESCKNCFNLARQDAKKSLSLYKQALFPLKTKHPVLYTNSLFQMAYLYRLINNKPQSINYLKQVVQMNINEPLTLRAYFNIAEIYFESYNYQAALTYFDKVIKVGNSPWAFRASYRQIWSLYNSSLYSQSMESLEDFLKSSTYNNKAVTNKEIEIKSKLQKELITLYTNSDMNIKHANFLYNFNKDDRDFNAVAARNQRLYNLARSLHRIGQAKISNNIWEMYLVKSSEHEVEVYASMIDNYFIMGEKSWLLTSGYSVAQKLFALKLANATCSPAVCETAHKQLKRYLQELARQENTNKEFQQKMLALYQSYNSVYVNEFDMLVKSAFISKDLKKYKLSQKLFQDSAKLLKWKMSQTKKEKDIKNTKHDLEQVSLLQLKTAELSKDKQIRVQAYDFYLVNGTNKDALYQSEYQKTYLAYQDKKYEETSTSFRKLALMEAKGLQQKTKLLPLQSAHLALSSLNFLKKQDALMAEWSLEFAKRFPQEGDFSTIYHTAIFNLIEKLTSSNDFSSYPISPSSNKDILKAWDVLNNLDVSKLTTAEKIKYYTNKLLLAKELLKLEEMALTISKLTNIKSLNKEDRKMVLTWNLWLAEIRFNFSRVLDLIRVLHSEETERHHLNLARLAELAGKDYISYYENFLIKYPNSKQRIDVIFHILEKSSQKNKKVLLKKYALDFKNQADVLSYWVFKLDDSHLDLNFLEEFAKLPFMKTSVLNQFLKRKNFIESFEKSFVKTNNFKLRFTSSSRKLTQSIKKYTQAISNLEKAAEPSVKMQDWLSQVIAFSKVHLELMRFQKSILNLPLPKGLSLEEQEEYKKLVATQMLPYKERANKLQLEIDKLLSKDFIDDYKDTVKNSAFYQGLVKWELSQLLPFISSLDQKQKTASLLELINKNNIRDKKEISASTVNATQLKQIYDQLHINPFNKNHLEKLSEMEKLRGNHSLVYYLDLRIEKISKARKNRVKL